MLDIGTTIRFWEVIMRPSTLYMTNAHLELYTFMVSAASVDTSMILPVVLHI